MVEYILRLLLVVSIPRSLGRLCTYRVELVKLKWAELQVQTYVKLALLPGIVSWGSQTTIFGSSQYTLEGTDSSKGRNMHKAYSKYTSNVHDGK